MSLNTASTFAKDVSLYIAQKTLSLALKKLVMYQIAEKAVLPKNSGRTFQYTRFERVALPLDTLTEGVTPGDTSMAISEVQAVMDQWGAVIPISDVAIDSIKHPVLQKAIELASMQAQETIDREMVKVAMSGTQIYFPGAVTDRASLAADKKISSALIGKVVSNLRDKGAQPYDQDLYVGVLDPFSEDDVTVDATFVDAAKYGMIKKLMVNEIGEWKGVRWVRCNTIPYMQLITGASGASSNTAGSLTGATTYNAKVALVDAKTGHETFVSAVFDAATDADKTSVDITIPAKPSTAPTGSTFNVYFGADGETLYLAASGVAAGATKNIGVLPTSGQVAPASPATGFKTHFSFVFGKGALCVPELNKIKSYLTPAAPSDSDPLVQRRKVGWKCDFKAVITNDDFMARMEHATTN